jgi:hypothetical protein
MTGKPALPCPPWCVERHAPHPDSSQHHRAERPIGDFDTGWVALVMTDYGDSALSYANGEVHIHLSWYLAGSSRHAQTVIRPLEEAEEFAKTAEAFARSDVAALIRELAALAEAPKPGVADSHPAGAIPNDETRGEPS